MEASPYTLACRAHSASPARRFTASLSVPGANTRLCSCVSCLQEVPCPAFVCWYRAASSHKLVTAHSRLVATGTQSSNCYHVAGSACNLTSMMNAVHLIQPSAKSTKDYQPRTSHMPEEHSAPQTRVEEMRAQVFRLLPQTIQGWRTPLSASTKETCT